MTGKRRAGKDPVPVQRSEPAMVIQPRPSRREERRARQREQRKKLGVVGGSVVALIAIAAIVVIAIGTHHVVTNGHGSKRTQQTILMQIQGADRSAIGSILLAHDPATKAGVEVMVQNRLITDVCGVGSDNFGDLLARPDGVDVSRSALSSVLGGVTIDGSWVLSSSQFTHLVDAVGGITVDVDTNVIQHTAGGGGRILVPAGSNRHLTGAQALEYASYQTSASTGAAAQLVRLQTVVNTMIQALPRDIPRLQALFRGLGPGGTSTLGSKALAQLLTGIAADNGSDNGVYPTDLTATAIDAGSGAPSYRPDTSATGIPELVHNHLRDSLPANVNSQHATVMLLNGTGQYDLVSNACAPLSKAGFTYAGQGNAPKFSNARSQVLIFHDSDVSQARVLAKALGLPASDVRRGTLNQDVAKFVVILGSDYKP